MSISQRPISQKHFISLEDYSPDEVQEILSVSCDLKAKLKKGEQHNVLAGKSVIMLFQKPSNRTRVSFEIGIQQLGAYPIVLRPSEIQMGQREEISDIAKVFSRYGDGVMMRVIRHTDILEFAEHSEVPIINGLSDLYHPCQAVSDLQTIAEHKLSPNGGSLKGLRICYIGDGNNVCNSLILMAARSGMDITVCCPTGYEPSLRVKGAPYTVDHDPRSAVSEADVVYTDVWTSMGQEEENLNRLRAFEGFTVSVDLMEQARKDAIFMHCLPAHRGEEVDNAILESKYSVVFDQAENRLHAQKAVMASSNGITTCLR